MTKTLLRLLVEHLWYNRHEYALAERLHDLMRDGAVTEIEQRTWLTASSGVRRDVRISGPGYSFSAEQWAFSSGHNRALDAVLISYKHQDVYSAASLMQKWPAIKSTKQGDVQVLKLAAA